MKTVRHLIAAACVAGNLIAAPVFAADIVNPNATAAVPTALPKPQTNRGITYITGGIGDEERSVLQQSKGDYNLHVTNADTNGAFVGNSKVVIMGGNGETVMEAVAGPIFYAKLPAGKYTMESTLGRQKMSHTFSISTGHSATFDLKWRPV